jgi:hypothetical protein
MTKEVRTLVRGFDTCFYQRTPHNLGNGLREPEPDERSVARENLVLYAAKTGYGIALHYAACGISGDANPSDTDRRLTRAVSLAASTMQIQFLDHLIMGAPAEGRAGYFSFKEAGLL